LRRRRVVNSFLIVCSRNMWSKRPPTLSLVCWI
jgi:hypothetical protein